MSEELLEEAGFGEDELPESFKKYRKEAVEALKKLKKGTTSPEHLDQFESAFKKTVEEVISRSGRDETPQWFKEETQGSQKEVREKWESLIAILRVRRDLRRLGRIKESCENLIPWLSQLLLDVPEDSREEVLKAFVSYSPEQIEL